MRHSIRSIVITSCALFIGDSFLGAGLYSSKPVEPETIEETLVQHADNTDPADVRALRDMGQFLRSASRKTDRAVDSEINRQRAGQFDHSLDPLNFGPLSILDDQADNEKNHSSLTEDHKFIDSLLTDLYISAEMSYYEEKIDEIESRTAKSDSSGAKQSVRTSHLIPEPTGLLLLSIAGFSFAANRLRRRHQEHPS